MPNIELLAKLEYKIYRRENGEKSNLYCNTDRNNASISEMICLSLALAFRIESFGVALKYIYFL